MTAQQRFAALWLCTAAVSATAQTTSRSIDLGAAFDTVRNISKSQSVASMSDGEEVLVGAEVAASTMGTTPLIRDEFLQRALNQIGVWVALQSTRPDLPWKFAAVESDAINAFAAPGGTVMITRGMLRLIANEAELACVIGHEVGHVSRRHHLAVLQKTLLAEAGVSALTVSAKSANQAEGRRRLLGEGKELFSKRLDRGAEREADEDGVLLAARAGYDPGACLVFMQRMAAFKGEDETLEPLYRTHPTAQERVADIERALTRLKGAAPGEGARPALALTRPATPPPVAAAAPEISAPERAPDAPAAGTAPPVAATAEGSELPRQTPVAPGSDAK